MNSAFNYKKAVMRIKIIEIMRRKPTTPLSKWTYFFGIPLSVGLAVALLFVIFMRDCREGVVEREVQFSVRAPKAVPAQHRVRETFPLAIMCFSRRDRLRYQIDILR